MEIIIWSTIVLMVASNTCFYLGSKDGAAAFASVAAIATLGIFTTPAPPTAYIATFAVFTVITAFLTAIIAVGTRIKTSATPMERMFYYASLSGVFYMFAVITLLSIYSA